MLLSILASAAIATEACPKVAPPPDNKIVKITWAYVEKQKPLTADHFVYMYISTKDKSDDILTEVSCGCAEKVQLRSNSRDVVPSFNVKANEELQLKASGRRLAIVALKPGFEQCQGLVMTLRFKRADPVTMYVPILKTPPNHPGAAFIGMD